MQSDQSPDRFSHVVTAGVLLLIGLCLMRISGCIPTKWGTPCPWSHPWGWTPIGALLGVLVLGLARFSAAFREQFLGQIAVIVATLAISVGLGMAVGFPPVYHTGLEDNLIGSPQFTPAYLLLVAAAVTRRALLGMVFLGAAATWAFFDLVKLVVV